MFLQQALETLEHNESLTLRFFKSGKGEIRLIASTTAPQPGKPDTDEEIRGLRALLQTPVVLSGTPEELEQRSLAELLRSMKDTHADINSSIDQAVARVKEEAQRVKEEQRRSARRTRRRLRPRPLTSRRPVRRPPRIRAHRLYAKRPTRPMRRSRQTCLRPPIHPTERNDEDRNPAPRVRRRLAPPAGP